jgi:hypothetical protein
MGIGGCCWCLLMGGRRQCGMVLLPTASVACLVFEMIWCSMSGLCVCWLVLWCPRATAGGEGFLSTGLAARRAPRVRASSYGPSLLDAHCWCSKTLLFLLQRSKHVAFMSFVVAWCISVWDLYVCSLRRGSSVQNILLAWSSVSVQAQSEHLHLLDGVASFDPVRGGRGSPSEVDWTWLLTQAARAWWGLLLHPRLATSSSLLATVLCMCRRVSSSASCASSCFMLFAFHLFLCLLSVSTVVNSAICGFIKIPFI